VVVFRNTWRLQIQCLSLSGITAVGRENDLRNYQLIFAPSNRFWPDLIPGEADSGLYAEFVFSENDDYSSNFPQPPKRNYAFKGILKELSKGVADNEKTKIPSINYSCPPKAPTIPHHGFRAHRQACLSFRDE